MDPNVKRFRDKQGNVFFGRIVTNPDGTRQWVRDEKTTSLYQQSGGALFNPKSTEEQQATKAAEDAMIEQRGDAAVLRKSYVDTMPFLPKLGLSAMREWQKIQPGLANVGDALFVGTPNTILDMAQEGLGFNNDPTGSRQRTMNFLDRWAKRAKNAQANNEVYRELDETVDLPTTLGRMMPYVLAERTVGPALRAGVKPIEEAVAKGFEAANEARKSVVRPLSVPIEGTTGQAVTEGLKSFPQRFVEAFKNPKTKPPKMVDPMFEGSLTDAIAGTGIMEGLDLAKYIGENEIQGNKDFGSGFTRTARDAGINALAGTGIGLTVRPWVTRMPNYWNEQGNMLTNWAKEKGFRLDPGLATGSRGLQKTAHALRAKTGWTDMIHKFDAANEVVTNRVLKSAMGLSGPDIEAFSPKILNDHITGLKSKVNDFTSQAKGVFYGPDMRDLSAQTLLTKQALLDKGKFATASDRAAYKAAGGYYNAIKKAAARVNDPNTGQFAYRELQGSDFTRIYRSLKNDIDAGYKALNNGQNVQPTLDALLPIKYKMEAALNQGASRNLTGANAKLFSDLREQQNITELALNKGLLTPTGSPSPKGLANYFKDNELKDMLLEKGSARRRDLWNLSKFNYLQREQLGSDLSGLGMAGYYNAAKETPFNKFIMPTMAKAFPGFMDDLMLTAWLSGYPSTTGFLNMSGKGFGNPQMYTRGATYAAGSIPEYTLNKAEEFNSWATPRAEKLKTTISKFLFGE